MLFRSGPFNKQCCTADESVCNYSMDCMFEGECVQDPKKGAPPRCESRFFSEDSCNRSEHCSWSHSEGQCVSWDMCRLGGKHESQDLCNASEFCHWKSRCSEIHREHCEPDQPYFGASCCKEEFQSDETLCNAQDECSMKSECVVRPELRALIDQEIGRASCRERVSTSV